MRYNLTREDRIRILIEEQYAFIIRNVFNLPKGEKYKKQLNLQKLIEHKCKLKNENELKQFELYVSFVDKIVEEINNIFPFINLEGITLEWTSEQIIDTICKMFFEIKSISINDLKKMNIHWLVFKNCH